MLADFMSFVDWSPEPMSSRFQHPDLPPMKKKALRYRPIRLQRWTYNWLYLWRTSRLRSTQPVSVLILTTMLVQLSYVDANSKHSQMIRKRLLLRCKRWQDQPIWKAEHRLKWMASLMVRCLQKKPSEKFASTRILSRLKMNFLALMELRSLPNPALTNGTARLALTSTTRV